MINKSGEVGGMGTQSPQQAEISRHTKGFQGTGLEDYWDQHLARQPKPPAPVPPAWRALGQAIQQDFPPRRTWGQWLGGMFQSSPSAAPPQPSQVQPPQPPQVPPRAPAQSAPAARPVPPELRALGQAIQQDFPTGGWRSWFGSQAPAARPKQAPRPPVQPPAARPPVPPTGAPINSPGLKNFTGEMNNSMDTMRRNLSRSIKSGSDNFLSNIVHTLNVLTAEGAFQEKNAGWWDTTKAFGSGLGQGAMNIGRGAMGIAETAAGGIGTLGAGIAAGGEALTDAAGITDPSFNTSWQAAKNMGEFTAGGAKNVGSVFGLRGADALMGREANPVTQSHERMMDEGRMSDRAKSLTRGGLGAGRAVAQAVPFIASGGTTAAGQLAAGGAYLGGEMLGTNPDRQLAAQRPGAQVEDWLPGGQATPSAAPTPTPPPAAPAENYKGFEIDGWRPMSGKDAFKMSSDVNFDLIKHLAVLASRKHYGRAGIA